MVRDYAGMVKGECSSYTRVISSFCVHVRKKESGSIEGSYYH